MTADVGTTVTGEERGKRLFESFPVLLTAAWEVTCTSVLEYCPAGGTVV